MNFFNRAVAAANVNEVTFVVRINNFVFVYYDCGRGNATSLASLSN
jgi:hypothetical protein